MRIGVPKEIKDREGRVALTPENVRTLIQAGHEVLVEAGAGQGSGFGDDTYLEAGAVLGGVKEAWDRDLVLKVKEPMEAEYGFLGKQILFTYLHLSGVHKKLTERLLENGTSAIGYETVEDADGKLPLLAPMSAIAGNMASLVGAFYLARAQGGKGVQLGEVLGVKHGKTLIVGDGVVAYHAAKTAHGLGSEVVVLGLDSKRGDEWSRRFGDGFRFELSSSGAIGHHLLDTDLLIGAVLKKGARAEAVVSRGQIASMQPGSVAVDVSIDQGGCLETSKPTSHSDPVYFDEGVLHYCVTNMPGAYPRTSTLALTSAVFPYTLLLANQGLDAVFGNPGFLKGLQVYQGKLRSETIARDLGLTGALDLQSR